MDDAGTCRCSQELILEVTDGQNGRAFGENADNKPSILAHYKAFKDLTASTYNEIGVSKLYGRNNEWTVEEELIDTVLDLEMWVPAVIDKAGNTRVRSGQVRYVAVSNRSSQLNRRAALLPLIGLLGRGFGIVVPGHSRGGRRYLQEGEEYPSVVWLWGVSERNLLQLC